MEVKIARARLCFPSLFEAEKMQGEDTGKYCATLLIPKDKKDLLLKIKEAQEEALMKIKVKNISLISSDHRLMRDGDVDLDKDKYPEYAGCYVIKAKNKVRPKILDIQKNIVDSKDRHIFYSGCYVNAIIDIFGYNNQSKGISSQLKGIMFAADGERLGANPVASDNCFDDFEAPKEDDVDFF